MSKYYLALMLVLATPSLAMFLAPYIAGWIVERVSSLLRV